jgi:succinate dehydrogenase / fumarate reductase cytochrome b subunit
MVGFILPFGSAHFLSLKLHRVPAVKSNRPVNLSLGMVLEVNMKSPVAMASILHRISGIIVFLLIPVLLYILQGSLASEESFDAIKESVFGAFLAVLSFLWLLLV